MKYEEARQVLEAHHFQRAERDDRIFDVFAKEIRDKGVELWDRYSEEQLTVARLPVYPFRPKGITVTAIPKKKIEELLQQNKQTSLSDFPTEEVGEDIQSFLEQGEDFSDK